jgi:hypothetical protein
MPVIIVTWEAEIGRFTIHSYPGQKVCETAISTNSWDGGTCLVSQLLRKHKQEDYSPGQKKKDPIPKAKRAGGIVI